MIKKLTVGIISYNNLFPDKTVASASPVARSVIISLLKSNMYSWFYELCEFPLTTSGDTLNAASGDMYCSVREAPSPGHVMYFIEWVEFQ